MDDGGGFSWPLPDNITDEALERCLLGRAPDRRRAGGSRSERDWAALAASEARRRATTSGPVQALSGSWGRGCRRRPWEPRWRPLGRAGRRKKSAEAPEAIPAAAAGA